MSPDVQTALMNVYVVLLVGLSAFSLHRLWLAWAARTVSFEPLAERGEGEPLESWPTVLVQLPMYNERYVAQRAVDAVCRLDYPRDRLTVQILDDSTDGTPQLVAERVNYWRKRGVSVEHICRTDRTGYKAGALSAGLAKSRAELVAIFDADFVPPVDFLRRAVGSMAPLDVGMVQARWTHQNRDESALTAVEAVLLDGHFVNEHGGRVARGQFFNFNGTCGIWRRACIDDAGGWCGSTLSEDLDLSYRAQLRGWRFIYRPDIEVPGELPANCNAFKIQQHRWAKGSIETARKLLPTIWQSRLGIGQKLEASMHMLGNLAYPAVLALAVITPWAIWVRMSATSVWIYLLDSLLLIGTTGTLIWSYALAEKRVGRRGWLTWRHFPLVLAVGVGLAVNNTRAVVEALLRRRSAFARTPKLGQARRIDPSYNPKANWQAWVEFTLGVYLLAAVFVAMWGERFAAVPFLALFAMGFLFLGIGSIRPRRTGSDLAEVRSMGRPVDENTDALPNAVLVKQA